MKGFRGAPGALELGGVKAIKGGERWYLSFLLSKMAGGASAPLVPLFVITVLGGGVGEVTLAVVAVSIASVPGFILWGDYSDRRGKRRLPLVGGMAMTSVAFLVMALSRDLPMFIAGNALFGFFLAATVPTSTILVIENHPVEEWGRAIGAFTRANGVGWMLGMVLGAIFFPLASTLVEVELAMRVFMGLCALFSALAWVTAMLWVPEPRARIDRRWLADELVALRTWTFERSRYIPTRLVFFLRPRVVRKARRLLPDWGRSLDTYLLATFVLFVGIQVFYVPFPVMLSEELLLSSGQIFLVYLSSAVAAAAMYAWAGKEVDQLGNRNAQLMAWGTRAVVFPMFAMTMVIFAWGYPVTAFILAMVLNGLTGLMFSILSVAGVTSVTDLAPDRIRGEAVGAYNAVTGVGMIIGGFLGGAIASLAGYLAVAIATGALTAVAVAMLYRLRFPSIGS
jgi:MFS family permease